VAVSAIQASPVPCAATWRPATAAIPPSATLAARSVASTLLGPVQPAIDLRLLLAAPCASIGAADGHQILDTVSGLVEQINAKRTGIKVAGEWLNISAYHPLSEIPTPGQRVDVQVEKTDRGAWINGLDFLDGGEVHQLAMPQQRRGGGGGGPSPAELREIRRLTVLKAAAAFGASRPDVKSSDVLAIADRWLTWVEQPGSRGGEQPA
jgi:hypothetical protein